MTDRADALWRRLAGMFGAETLARKFGESPPEEWRLSLSRLTDFELQRGLRRLNDSGKGHVPTLPEFLRMCREVGGDYADPVPPSRQISQQPMARWEAEGGLHLLGYILRQSRHKVFFDPDQTARLVEAKKYWAQNMRELEEEGNLPTDGGKALWAEYMAGAEAAIRATRAA